MKTQPHRALLALSLATVVALAACAVAPDNAGAVQRLEAPAPPAGSVYLGWRVFEDRCARCHGTSATGKPGAPDVLAGVRTLGPREFADVVLLRYWWPALPSSDPRNADREAYIDDLVQRRTGDIVMPAWQGEPQVTAHVIDLHAYLSARAEGTQGPGRPAGP